MPGSHVVLAAASSCSVNLPLISQRAHRWCQMPIRWQIQGAYGTAITTEWQRSQELNNDRHQAKKTLPYFALCASRRPRGHLRLHPSQVGALEPAARWISMSVPAHCAGLASLRWKINEWLNLATDIARPVKVSAALTRSALKQARAEACSLVKRSSENRETACDSKRSFAAKEVHLAHLSGKAEALEQRTESKAGSLGIFSMSSRCQP